MQLSVLSLSLSKNYTRAPQNDTWKMHFWCLRISVYNAQKLIPGCCIDMGNAAEEREMMNQIIVVFKYLI